MPSVPDTNCQYCTFIANFSFFSLTILYYFIQFIFITTNIIAGCFIFDFYVCLFCIIKMVQFWHTLYIFVTVNFFGFFFIFDETKLYLYEFLLVWQYLIMNSMNVHKIIWPFSNFVVVHYFIYLYKNILDIRLITASLLFIGRCYINVLWWAVGDERFIFDWKK